MTQRSVGLTGARRQHRVRPRRRVPVPAEPARDRYLLGADADPGTDRFRRGQPPGVSRLRRRPLRVPRGAAHGGRRLQPGGRLRAAQGHAQERRARFRFSPRLWSVDAIRKLSWRASVDYIENLAGRPETRESDADFGIEFENSDRFRLRYRRSFEYLPEPFEIAPDVVLPVRGYDFDMMQARYSFGSQRMATADVRVEHGGFFSGRRTALLVRRGRAEGRAAVRRRADLLGQLDRSGRGRVHHAPGGLAGRLHDDPEGVHQRAAAVQLGEPHGGRQRALPLGVPAGERAVRRLQRAARHVGAPASRSWRAGPSSSS